MSYEIKGKFLDWWLENLSGFSALLFDIDGTLILGHHALPGANEMLEWLRNHHFPFFLLTNDGNHSLEEKSGFLHRAELEVSPDEIVSCSSAIKILVEDQNRNGELFFVMGDLGKPDYAEEAGLRVTRNIDEIDDCKGIICGEGYYDWHKTFNAVINTYIKDPSRPLIVPNPDSYWPNGPNGEIGVGAGGKARFIASLLGEMGIKLEPVYLGKPYPAIFKYTISQLTRRFGIPDSIPHSRIMMLGDNLKSDILGAKNLGFKSVLMLSGITGKRQAEQAPEELQPDFIFESL